MHIWLCSLLLVCLELKKLPIDVKSVKKMTIEIKREDVKINVYKN